jgi:hypothetical protein
MQQDDLWRRAGSPEPWSEGEYIPCRSDRIQGLLHVGKQVVGVLHADR